MVEETIVSSKKNKARKDMNKGYYEKKKRKNKIDNCNICGKLLPLTWDHVPPKFCFNDGSVKYNSMMEFHGKDVKKEISQNGIKYRTLCDDCNNRILGAEYDREYKRLVDTLYNLYISPGDIAQYIVITGLKINRVARAVVGHLLAAREDYFDGELENELRKFVLDQDSLPPKNLKLLYYTYPYNTVMIVRDIVPMKIGNQDYKVPSCFMSCLNTFPIAFILASECKDACGLYDMFELCTSNIDEEIDIKIDILSYLFPNHLERRNPYWPCNVSDEDSGVSLVLTSEVAQHNSVISDVRTLKKR